ncbi:hypothetical protein [Comamonas sp.]|uniref:hypothetical protein n=1 Tax=Comamonas sp. TaxID=34028 RepID=UPI0012C127CA|nr:hypothetical protein [Comamonas sp.]MPT12425.1 hypothetical protein [Comamonas sp.]
MSHTITALHSYRAILIPKNANAADIEDLADAGQLPTIRVKAPSCEQAEVAAQHVSGKKVLRAERVEG